MVSTSHPFVSGDVAPLIASPAVTHRRRVPLYGRPARRGPDTTGGSLRRRVARADDEEGAAVLVGRFGRFA